jgi:hypothetical protein
MLGIGENTRLLQRYELLERAGMRFSAGWAMAATAWDAKVMLGRHMWQDAQRADRLRRRLKELRSGPLSADNRAGLSEVVDYTARAMHTAEYIAGMYGVVKAALLTAYRRHLELTDFVLDDGTVDALQLNCVSLQEQLDWAAALPQMRLEPPFEAEACGRWQAAVRLRLREAGGIDGSEPEEEAAEAPERPPFQRPHTQTLDGYLLQRGRDAPPDESDAPAWRLYVFRNFMNEVGAGDNVASVVFDAPEHTDWGLIYDVARHGWDEYRHAMMGLRRLRELGFDPAGLPLGTGTFEYRDRLSPLERFGMLVFIHEAPAFGYKHGSRKCFSPWATR